MEIISRIINIGFNISLTIFEKAKTEPFFLDRTFKRHRKYAIVTDAEL